MRPPNTFAWLQSLEEWMLLVYTDQMYQYWDLRETKKKLAWGPFSFSFENGKRSQWTEFIYQFILVKERQRIQGFCLVLWNSSHCPYVSKPYIAHLELFGLSILYLHPDIFHPISFIPKSSDYFLLEVISKLADSNQNSTCFYPKSTFLSLCGLSLVV